MMDKLCIESEDVSTRTLGILLFLISMFYDIKPGSRRNQFLFVFRCYLFLLGYFPQDLTIMFVVLH